MGKLFKLALEEAVVEEPSIVENVPVEEAVQNAEELAKTDSEIQQDIAAVEELMEEKAKLEDQAVTNDELLSNPDAVITSTDVEVSEETRTEVQYALGYTSSMGKIRLSQESVLNDVRSNPRKYLAISNEDIKDTIKKVIEKIKAFIAKILEKLKIKKTLIGKKMKNIVKWGDKAKNTMSNRDESRKALEKYWSTIEPSDLTDFFIKKSIVVGRLFFDLEDKALSCLDANKFIDTMLNMQLLIKNITNARTNLALTLGSTFAASDFDWLFGKNQTADILKLVPDVRDKFISVTLKHITNKFDINVVKPYAFNDSKVFLYCVVDSDLGTFPIFDNNGIVLPQEWLRTKSFTDSEFVNVFMANAEQWVKKYKEFPAKNDKMAEICRDTLNTARFGLGQLDYLVTTIDNSESSMLRFNLMKTYATGVFINRVWDTYTHLTSVTTSMFNKFYNIK